MNNNPLGPWRHGRLGDEALTEINYGKANPKKEGNIPVIGSSGVYDSTNEPLVDAPSILIGRKGNAGSIQLIKEPCWPSDTTFYLKLKSKKLDYNFLSEYLTYRKLSSEKTQTTLPSLSIGDLRYLRIPIPPIGEQRGIVEVLGTVDECIRLTDTVIERAEELKRGLMQQLLTRGIGHTEYKETPLGKIPKTWKIEKYNEICDKITVGIVVKPAQYYTESGVPCLRSLNILEDHIIPSNLVYISEESNTLLKKSKVKKGDIVTIRTGKPGASAVIDDDFDGCNIIDLIISKPKKEVNPHYLSKYLNSFLSKKQILSMQAGAVQVHLNVGTIKQIKVILPPFKEQLKIMDILQIQEKRINIENQKKENLNLLKQGLMQLLLSGKIRVELKGDGLHRIGDGREANN